MPLPLIDEPIVDLLWVETGHRCKPHLIFLLSEEQHQIIYQTMVTGIQRTRFRLFGENVGRLP
jgi:hypothetical protein